MVDQITTKIVLCKDLQDKIIAEGKTRNVEMQEGQKEM